jgi:hypothetical protein
LLSSLYLHVNGRCGEHSTLPSLSGSLSCMHASSGKVKSEYSAAIAFQRMSYTNFMLHTIRIFEKKIYKFSPYLLLLEKWSNFLRFSRIAAHTEQSTVNTKTCDVMSLMNSSLDCTSSCHTWQVIFWPMLCNMNCQPS